MFRFRPGDYPNGGLEPFAIWSVVDSLIELTVGFAYVWLVNALEL